MEELTDHEFLTYPGVVAEQAHPEVGTVRVPAPHGDAVRPAAPRGAEVRPPITIHYSKMGRGPVTLLLVHGITAHSRHWLAPARELVQTGSYTLIIPDLRGRGKSSKPPTAASYGLEAHTRDLKAILDHEHVRQCVYVGHSMGAWLGLSVVAALPTYFTHLVLVDGGYPSPLLAANLPNLKSLARVKGRLTMTFASPQAYLDYMYGPGAQTVEGQGPDGTKLLEYELAPVEGGYRCQCSPVCPDVDTGSLIMIPPMASYEALSQLVVRPTLLLYAEHGFSNELPPLITAELAGDMKTRAHVEVQFIPGSNHYTIIREPTIAGHIHGFLTRPPN